MQLDMPKIKTHPVPERLLFSKALALIFLGALLYLAIYLNYWVWGTPIPVFVNWLIVVGIAILLVLETLLCYVKYAQYNYTFYGTKIVVEESDPIAVQYSAVRSISFKQNAIDRLFKTASIGIYYDAGSRRPRTIRLKSITQANQAYFFLQKMIRV